MRNIKPLKKPVIASSVSSSGERKAFSFVLLSAGMLSIPAWRGVGCFDDTVQYIAMHIRRETVYPLYLAFSRLFFGSSDQPGVTGKAGLMVSTSQWELFGLDFYPRIAASTNHLSLALLLTPIRSQIVGMIPLWALVTATAAAVCRSAKSAARSGISSSCAYSHDSSPASLHHSSCSVSRSLILRILNILAAAGVALAARGTAMAALLQAAGIRKGVRRHYE